MLLPVRISEMGKRSSKASQPLNFTLREVDDSHIVEAGMFLGDEGFM